MKLCPSCGSPAEELARFCLECGHAFDADAADPEDPWLGRMIAGRFRIVRKLGDGGMGEVFVAEQLPMGRLVAIKVLRQALSEDPQQVERFKREAQAASQLKHQHTIIVHDFGQDADGTLFIAMELLEGRTLAELLEETPTLSPERAASILSQICGSLEEAHGHGVIHRDLKPENIFLITRGGSQDFVKVLDFGIAKVTQSSTGGKLETITRAGAIFGTPQYMSPEQIRGEELDARSDVYALGVMFYQVLSGHLPFDAQTVVEMLTKHLTTLPAPFTRGPDTDERSALARLEAVAIRALAKDRNQRQPTARAFLEDIMNALPQLTLNPLTGLVPASANGADLGSDRSIATPQLDVPGRSRVGAVMVLTALVAAAAVGTALYFKGSPLSPLPPDAGRRAPDVTPVVMAQDAEGDKGGAVGGDAAGADTPEIAPEDAAKAEAEAEAEAKKAEVEAEKAAAEADKPLDKEAAAKVAAEAEEEEKKADEEAKAAAEAKKAADAEKKAKETEEKAKAAEEKKRQAEAAKAEAEAAKAMAEAEKKAAAAAKEEADAKRQAAGEEAAKAKAEAEAKAELASAAKAEAEKLRAELEAVKAERASAEERAAVAEATIEEAKQKKAEAKARGTAAKKGQRAKPGVGQILVSAPAGSSIMINGKMRARAPAKPIRLSPGKYTIEARYKGKTAKQQVAVTAGKVVRISLKP